MRLALNSHVRTSVILATYPEPLRSLVLANRAGHPDLADYLREVLATADRQERELHYGPSNWRGQ